jgi:hypothetical protein
VAKIARSSVDWPYQRYATESLSQSFGQRGAIYTPVQAGQREPVSAERKERTIREKIAHRTNVAKFINQEQCGRSVDNGHESANHSSTVAIDRHARHLREVAVAGRRGGR